MAGDEEGKKVPANLNPEAEEVTLKLKMGRWPLKPSTGLNRWPPMPCLTLRPMGCVFSIRLTHGWLDGHASHTEVWDYWDLSCAIPKVGSVSFQWGHHFIPAALQVTCLGHPSHFLLSSVLWPVISTFWSFVVRLLLFHLSCSCSYSWFCL